MGNRHCISNDTMVARATPQGVGAIAIVRLSGERALDIASEVVKDSADFKKHKSRHLFFVDLIKEDATILDRALCCIFRKPRSYTGETVVEFYIHGGTYITSRTIDLCVNRGARLAEPGEFTLRAFLNGRMDLAQAESVADLIAADGALAHRAAMLQRKGALSKRITKIRKKLIELYSLVELEIDFTDQDLPVINKSDMHEILQNVNNDLIALEYSYNRGRLGREGATVVIAGPQNVGKSTLFNMIVGEERAIVHESPGTTRDSVEALIEWGGLTIKLIDTAGQRDLFSGPDKTAVERAKHASISADAVLWVVDLSDTEQPPPPDNIAANSLIIGNKSDLLVEEKRRVNYYYIETSALKGIGLEKIKESLLNKLLPGNNATLEEGVITRERHFDCVRRGKEAVVRAFNVLRGEEGLELLAADLREATDALGEIVGEVTDDEILNRIFKDFCIGK